jgi:glycogen debranching enzyme
MDDRCVVIRRFPAYELAVRRLYASDPEFRDACEHYALAVHAFERWVEDETKAEEYRRMIRELEDEIIEYFEPSGMNTH